MLSMKMLTIYETARAKKVLLMSEKQIYDIVLDIIQPRLKQTPALQGLEFSFDTWDNSSGTFTYTKGKKDWRLHETWITINLSQIRTQRDLVFTAFHEWAHALQYFYNPKRFARLAEDLRVGTTEYVKNELEVEADAFAFEQEGIMNYKNSLINPTSRKSIFIERKTIRNMGL